jgi:glycosyltransferase involved in cell wall biosynthesis
VPTLHVVIPVYNEPGTLATIVERVRAAVLPSGWQRAVVLVDDCSAPKGRTAVEGVHADLLARGASASLLRHAVNRGKGAALRSGFDHVLTHASDDDAVIIQDADLEYDPADFAAMLEPVLEGWADAVYGTRWGSHRPVRSVTGRVHAAGNRVLTLLSNVVTGLHVDDMECCYKLLTIPTLRAIRPRLTEDRFGIEPQITAGLAAVGARLGQRQISYAPRGFRDGKKIGWVDGLRALFVILRERMLG